MTASSPPLMRSLLLLIALVLATSGLRAQSNFPVTPSGLKYLVTEYGRGLQARPGRVVTAHYVGKLRDGTVFHDTRRENRPIVFQLGRGEVMAGWEEGFLHLHGGAKGILVIPPALATGGKPVPNLPPDKELVFEITVIEVKEPAAR
jgi:FKBP-type peptidyl-prolyl cis-trans isomerase